MAVKWKRPEHKEEQERQEIPRDSDDSLVELDSENTDNETLESGE